MIRLFAAPARTLTVNTPSRTVEKTADARTERFDEPDRLREASNRYADCVSRLYGMQPRIALECVHRIRGPYICKVRPKEHTRRRMSMP